MPVLRVVAVALTLCCGTATAGLSGSVLGTWKVTERVIECRGTAAKGHCPGPAKLSFRITVRDGYVVLEAHKGNQQDAFVLRRHRGAWVNRQSRQLIGCGSSLSNYRLVGTGHISLSLRVRDGVLTGKVVERATGRCPGTDRPFTLRITLSISGHRSR